tara:strand:- start:5259 stop:5624 length:366 start_codon:yes stop_codon:yes gene_type:complete
MADIEIATVEEPKKFDKRSITSGRKQGNRNYNTYKWLISIHNTEGNIRTGKFVSIKQANEKLGLRLNSDYVRRIVKRYRVDEDAKMKDSSFIARWGHIQILKINEPVSYDEEGNMINFNYD